MTAGVYRIRNTLNGKVYIGSSKDMDLRWDLHRYALNRGDRRCCPPLLEDWIKYGESAFIFEVIESRRFIRWRPDLIALEQVYLDAAFASGLAYNVCPTAGTTRGMKFGPLTAKHRIDISVANKGHKHSAETRAQMSASHRGMKHTAETRANMSASRLGNTYALGYEFTTKQRADLSATRRMLAIARMARPVQKPPWWNARAEYRVQIAPRLQPREVDGFSFLDIL
jgi:group I intron endonuclease